MIGITDDAGIPSSFFKEDWTEPYWNVVEQLEKYAVEFVKQGDDKSFDASEISNFLIVFNYLISDKPKASHSRFVKELLDIITLPGYVPIATRMVEEKKIAIRVKELIENPVELWKTVSNILDDVIVGEKFNKLTLFLLILSMEHVYVTGDSSSGKSYLISNVLKTFPQEWIVTLGDMSEKAIQYMDWGYEGPGPQDNPTKRILYLQEFVGVSDNKDKQFRLLSGDDGGMTWTTTVRKDVKNSEGEKESKFVTQEGKTPQLSFVTSTTRANLNEENMTRAWRIIPSPSPDQTSDIIDRDNQWGMYPWRKPRTIARVNEIRAVLKEIDPKKWRGGDNKYRVSQPFLTLCNFPTDKVRIRRDRAKVERMSAIITIINQSQRPRITIDGLEYLIGSASDLALGLYLTQQILQHTLLGLDDKALAIWNLVDQWEKTKEIVKESNVGMTVTDMLETTDVVFTQRKIQDTCTYLVDTGYLYSVSIDARGMPNGFFTKSRPDSTSLDVHWSMKEQMWSAMKDSLKNIEGIIDLSQHDDIILDQTFPDFLKVAEEVQTSEVLRRMAETKRAKASPLEVALETTRDDEIDAKIEAMEGMHG